MAARVLDGEATPAEMAIESASGFDFAINGEVAEAIGIVIPENLVEYIIEQ
jgi:ABC-type uncharacterized transport system substrate-binding protein